MPLLLQLALMPDQELVSKILYLEFREKYSKVSFSLICLSWWTGGSAAPVPLANIFEVSIQIYLKQGYKYL